ncbi:beta-N-acetylhexosaminidase [Paenibacillus donghaensis]|uniref:Beta-N-acetylhexosaminidase n=1 Tax=Paenibacillus donghaensis TaxID=414771 RepID=A0A2Z2KT03_9BACL|nr:beta-N-acetylhexosaminidase [Paenibacillus donghaensis]
MAEHRGGIRKKVGQLFMCGFMDTRPNDNILKLITDYNIGGVIYFRRNIGTPEEVYECSAGLQQAASEPLLIAIDQEGGMVARIEQGVTLMPGNMALGATRDPEGVFEAARIAGLELRQLGMNMNFAPCVDVNNNPTNPVIGVRSFGETPQLVASLGAAAAAGYQNAGVAATLKHFPGHGDTDTDSHLALPTIPHPRERLETIELAPFRHIIKTGVDAIMTAHVVFPAYEEQEIPATLSKNILTGLLRQKLGFEGVIVTDCLEMNAIAQTVGVGTGAVQAVQAGADLILVSHRFDWQVEAIEAVIGAVERGEISEARIDDSISRLQRLKLKRGILKEEPAGFAAIRDTLATTASHAFAQKLSEHSITLVKDEGQLPLSGKERTYVIWPEVRVHHEVVEALREEVTLGGELSELIPQVDERIIDADPSEEEIGLVLTESAAYTQIVAVTYNAGFSGGQRRILTELVGRTGTRLIVVAARDPFDYTAVPGIRTYLACYENKPLAMQSVAKVLTGQLPARGRLPVTVGEFHVGTGIQV